MQVSEAAETDDLMELARSRHPTDRERLLVAIVELCSSAEQAAEAPPVQDALDSIFLRLVTEAEYDIRKRLAQRLASAAWAPPALVSALAGDDIEIAHPVIAESPVLKDQDLVRLLAIATLDHQIAVARRPRLPASVVDLILKREEPALLTALACNDTAEISPEGMAQLVEASRKIASLRSPLGRHPRLSSELAERLYVWVGQSLRSALVSRFRIDAEALDAAIAATVSEIHAEQDAGLEADSDRLIEKLHDAGQLKPGYLLRALRERRLPLFVSALARLGHFHPEHVWRAIDSDRPELLALACAAVGIDRGAFPSILATVRDLNNGKPGGGAEGARRAIGAFGPFKPGMADQAFRRTIAAV